MNITQQLLDTIAQSSIGDTFIHEGKYYIIAPGEGNNDCKYCVFTNLQNQTNKPCELHGIKCVWYERVDEINVIIMEFQVPVENNT